MMMQEATQPQPAAGGIIGQEPPTEIAQTKITNPHLRQLEQGIEQAIPPDHRAEYDKVVMSGLGMMADPKLHGQFMEFLETAGQVPPEQRSKAYAHGPVKAITVTFNEAIAKIPPARQERYKEMLPLAGLTLMAHVLNFAEGALGEEVTKEDIAMTGRDVVGGILSLFPEGGEQGGSSPGMPEGAPEPGMPDPAMRSQPAARPPMGGGMM